jgi:hypothetical protein
MTSVGDSRSEIFIAAPERRIVRSIDSGLRLEGRFASPSPPGEEIKS